MLLTEKLTICVMAEFFRICTYTGWKLEKHPASWKFEELPDGKTLKILLLVGGLKICKTVGSLKICELVESLMILLEVLKNASWIEF